MLEVLKYSRRGKGVKLAGDKTIFLKYWKLLKVDKKDTKFNILFSTFAYVWQFLMIKNKSKQTILTKTQARCIYLSLRFATISTQKPLKHHRRLFTSLKVQLRSWQLPNNPVFNGLIPQVLKQLLSQVGGSPPSSISTSRHTKYLRHWTGGTHILAEGSS